MSKGAHFFFFLILFFLLLFFFSQFEEVFLETREQYEKLLQSEYIWDLKISVSRFRSVPEKIEDCVYWLPYGKEGIRTELWAAAETECFHMWAGTNENWMSFQLAVLQSSWLFCLCAAAKTLLAKIHLRWMRSFWLASLFFFLSPKSSALQQLIVSWP